MKKTNRIKQMKNSRKQDKLSINSMDTNTRNVLTHIQRFQPHANTQFSPTHTKTRNVPTHTQFSRPTRRYTQFSLPHAETQAIHPHAKIRNSPTHMQARNILTHTQRQVFFLHTRLLGANKRKLEEASRNTATNSERRR